jgi:CMP-N-acetylneuraminic acid synthetase
MISKGICNKEIDDFSYLGLTKYTIVKAMAKKKLNPPTLR